jgi:hypothetical protein
MDDIIPQSENYKEGKSQDLDSTEVDDFDFNTDLARELGIEVMELDSFVDPTFPDRFLPKKALKLNLQLKEDKIFFGQWIYKDSIKTRNALYNWLDCFGSNCKSIKYLESRNFQPEAMLIFVNDTSINYISSPLALRKEQWQQYFEKYNRIDSWDNVIVQRKKGKAEWLYFGKLEQSNKNQFIPIKNLNP